MSSPPQPAERQTATHPTRHPHRCRHCDPPHRHQRPPSQHRRHQQTDEKKRDEMTSTTEGRQTKLEQSRTEQGRAEEDAARVATGGCAANEKNAVSGSEDASSIFSPCLSSHPFVLLSVSSFPLVSVCCVLLPPSIGVGSGGGRREEFTVVLTDSEWEAVSFPDSRTDPNQHETKRTKTTHTTDTTGEEERRRKRKGGSICSSVCC